MDAAIAAHAVLGLVEPVSSGLGGSAYQNISPFELTEARAFEFCPLWNIQQWSELDKGAPDAGALARELPGTEILFGWDFTAGGLAAALSTAAGLLLSLVLPVSTPIKVFLVLSFFGVLGGLFVLVTGASPFEPRIVIGLGAAAVVGTVAGVAIRAWQVGRWSRPAVAE